MFVLPSNDRDSVLTSALQGLAKSGNILSEHVERANTKKNRTEAMKRLSSGKLDIGSILKANLDPKETAALIQHLTERGSGFTGSGGSPSSAGNASSMSNSQGRPTASVEGGLLSRPGSDSQGRPTASVERGLEYPSNLPQPQAKQKQKKHWNFIEPDEAYAEKLLQEKGTRGLANYQKNLELNNQMVAANIKANEPIVQTVYEHANSGRDLIQQADMLEELVKSGDLMSPAAAWFHEITGVPAASLFGGVDDEIFSKVTNSLLGPYLKQNYAGLGRVLQSEVQSQKAAIVSAKNSDEAKSLLINLIRDLGQAGIDNEKDYHAISSPQGFGPGDPELRKHLNELAEERWENTPISFGLSDGRNIMIKRKDRDKVLQLDAELAQEALQPKINNSPVLTDLHSEKETILQKLHKHQKQRR